MAACHRRFTDLECDTNTLAVAVEHRPPTVAAVDSCVDLECQQVSAAMAVICHL